MPNKAPTYEDHESEPGHRPGMEKVVNRNPDGTVQVSPPTQSAFGPASASDPPPPKSPPPKAPPADTSPGSGTLGRQRTAAQLQVADDAS